MTEPTPPREKLLSWLWKILLIIAAAVPIFALVFSWSQNNFEMPMPEAVKDSILTSPLVFSVFIGLIVVSFAVQYVLGSPVRRKNQIKRRTPILIFVGPVVALVLSLLVWWQSGASLTDVFSEVAQELYMLGSIAGLTAGSLILAFAMSTRKEQKRGFKVLITLASVFLMFGGPTYFIYGLQAVKIPYSYTVFIGLVSFIIGVIIFLRFVAKETKI